MKVINLCIKKAIFNDLFQVNAKIEQIYTDIAFIVLSRILKAFPFNPLFSSLPDENMNHEETFKFLVMNWADALMEWGINDLNKANKAVDALIYNNLIPSLGLFKAYYEGRYELTRIQEYEEYIFYVSGKAKFIPVSFEKMDALMEKANDVMTFWDWQKNRINSSSNVDKPKALIINLTKTKELTPLHSDKQKDYINPAFEKITTHSAFMEVIKGMINIKAIE